MFFRILAALLWLPCLYGYGIFAQRILGLRFTAPVYLFGSRLLLGWFVLSVLAVALHFGVAIGPVVGYLLLAGGYALLVIFRSQVRTVSGRLLATYAVAVALLHLVGPVAFEHFDTGLYHMQLLLWVQDGPLALGLSNVHGRFSFNPIWPVVGAVLPLPPNPARAWDLVNPLFLSVALAFPVCAVRSRDRSAAMVLFVSLILPVFLLATTPFNGTVSPDIAVPLCILLTVALLFAGFASVTDSDRDSFHLVALATAFYGVTVKLNATPLAAACLILIMARADAAKPLWRRMAILGLFLLVPWLARNVISSGCLLYPVPWTRLPVSWAMTPGAIENDLAWTRSWARSPGMPPSQALTSDAWVETWKSLTTGDRNFPFMISLLVLAIVCSLPYFLYRRRDVVAALKTALVPVTGLVFWFLTAPDLRFGFGYILALGVLPFALFVGFLLARGTASARAGLAFTVFALMAAVILHSGTTIRGGAMHRFLRPTALLTVPSGPVTESRDGSGNPFYIGARQGQCWDAPRPCGPHSQPNLRSWRGRRFVFRPGIS